MTEVDLALWRSAEDVAHDKRQFMNDGEWELLSVPSRYRHIQQDASDYAQIQFNASVGVGGHLERSCSGLAGASRG